MKVVQLRGAGRLSAYISAFVPAVVVGVWMVIGAVNATAQDWQFVSGSRNGGVFGSGGEILVVGAYGTIFRSGDQGKTWEMPKSGTYYTLQDVVQLRDGSYLVVGDGGTMLRSGDGGESWGQVESGTDVDLQEIAQTGGSRVYVLGAGGRLFRSENDGKSWEERGVLPEGVGGVSFMNGEVGIAAGPSGRVYRTTDGGGEWGEVYRDTTVSFLDASFAGGSGFGLVSGSGSVILRTVDSGRTWERDSLGFEMKVLSVAVEESGRAFVSGQGTQRPDRAMVGRSMDSGRTWEPVSFPFPQDISKNPALDVVLGGAGEGMVMLDDGCIYRTEDNWESSILVTQLEHKLGDSKIWFKNPAFGSAMTGVVPNGLLGGFVWTTNGGITWQERKFGAGTYAAASFFSETDGIMVHNDSPTSLVRTTDGGASWFGGKLAKSESGAARGDVRQMEFLDSLNGYQIGTTSIFLDQAKGFFNRTTDGGITLNGQVFDYPKTMSLSSFISQDMGWIGGGNPAIQTDSLNQGYEYGTVLRTTDGGETWQTVYDHYGVYGTPLLLRFRNAEHGVICVGGDGYGHAGEAVLLETTDGGESWNVKSAFPLAQAPLDLVFLNERWWYAVGGKSSIWETTDGGETWRSEEIDPLPKDNFGLLPPFSSITLLPDDRTMIAAGNSVMARRVFPQKVTGVSDEGGAGVQGEVLRVLPNVATDKVWVSLQKNAGVSSRAVTLLVYDAAGGIVKRMAVAAGISGGVELEVGSLASGRYRVVAQDRAAEVLGEAPLVIVH